MAAVYDPDELNQKENDPYKTKWGGNYGSDKPKSSKPNSDASNQAGNEPGADHSQNKDSGSSGNVENQLGKGYTGGGSPDGAARIRKFLTNWKALAFIGIPSMLLISFVLFVVLIFPTLKIPQLAAHIEEYRLARLARTFNRQAAILTSDKAALDSDPAVAAAETKGFSSTTLDKLKGYNPRSVFKNMKATGVLDFDYGKGALGAEKLNAIIINGNRVEVPNYKFGRQINNYKERVRFSAEINANLDSALNDKNYLVRTSISKKLLKAYGINLRWYERLGRNYKGLKQAEADRLMLRDTEEKINTPPEDNLKTGPIKQAAQEAADAEAACLKSDSCTDELIKNNGMAPEITNAIDSSVKTGGLDKFLSVVSPTFAVGVPVCLVYDGSVEASKPFVDSQSQAAVTTFFAVASGADQQKTGDVTAEAVQAFNHRIGDIANSIPERRASGLSVDTSDEISPQSARSGSFSVFNLISPNASVAKAANVVAENVCPALTDVRVAAGIVVGNLIASLFTGGGVEAGEQAVKTAATSVIDRVTSRIIAKVATVEGRAAVKNSAKKYAASSAKAGAATTGATYLARMLVLSEMGAFVNGMDSADFANQADMGGSLYGNEITRQGFYGRPLTNQESGFDQKIDEQFIARQKRNQGFVNKYLAIKNPNSAANHLLNVAHANLKISKIVELPGIIAKLPSIMASSFRPIFGHASAETADTPDYNIVQWGWSPAEENLIDNDSSFDPLENAQIVKDSGQADAIASKYGKCFSDSVGTLISNGDLKRDNDGNLVDDGGCSPSKLGPDNSEFGPQMIFRWRLDQSYQSTLDELTGIQNVSG